MKSKKTQKAAYARMAARAQKEKKVKRAKAYEKLFNRLKRLIPSYKIVLPGLFLIAFFLLFNFRFWYWQADYADTAYFNEVTKSLTRWNWFGSHFGGSIALDFKQVIGNPNLHKLSEIPSYPIDAHFNAFYNHAYLILIPVAALVSVFDYRTTIYALVVITTLAPFAMLLFTIRHRFKMQNRFKYFLVGLACAVILLCFPGINDLALGQFYPDRLIVLFLPLAMIYIEKLAVVNDRRTNLILIILAIMCMSATERGSLYIAFVSIFLLLFRVLKNRNRLRETLRNNASILFVSITALLWTGIYVSKIARNQDTEGFIYSFTHFSLVNSHVFSVPSLKMLILSLPLILVAAQYLDLFLISIIAVLPNLLGTFGFSLKTGWLTHYMSYMAAALVGAFLLALKRDSEQKAIQPKLVGQTSNFQYRIILASALSILSVFLINPTTNLKVIEATKEVRLGTFTHAAYWWAHRDLRENLQRNIAVDYKLAGSVPWNSSVVATEATAPLVSGRVKNVDYYPINLKSDDYVLIHSISSYGQPFSAYQMVDYSSDFAAKSVTAEVTKLLLSDCFELVKRNLNSNLYLFHRIKAISSESACHSRNG